MKKWLLLLGAVICTECVLAENIKITNKSGRLITVEKVYATKEDFDEFDEKLASSANAKKLECPDLPLKIRVRQKKSLSVESPVGYKDGFGIVFSYMKDGKKITDEDWGPADDADLEITPEKLGIF